MYKTIFYLSFLIFLFSCNSENLNDNSKRNADYAWKIPDGKTQGEWVKIDRTGNADDFFRNGDFTFFYSDGSIYSKTHYDENGDYDTLFCYDINEELTHYISPINEDSSHIFIYNDGEFKSYDIEGELIVSGFTFKNILSLIKLEDYLLEYVNIIYAQKDARKQFTNSLSELADYYRINPNLEKELTFKEKRIIDSIYIVSKHKFDSIILKYNSLEIFKQNELVYDETKKYLISLNDIFNKVTEINSLLKPDLNKETHDIIKLKAIELLKNESSNITLYQDKLLQSSYYYSFNEFHVNIISKDF